MKTNDMKLTSAFIFLAILGMLMLACKDEVLVPVNDTKKADSLIAVITKLDKQDVTINTRDNIITIKNATLNAVMDSLNNGINNPRKIQYTVYLINAGNSVTTTNPGRTKGVDGATVSVFAGGKTLTSTSADGRVIFEGLGGGNATVQISASGFAPVTFHTFFFDDNRGSFGDGAVRTASTNILIFPTTSKEAVTITGQIYANKSTIDDTLGRQYSNAGDASKYRKYISNPGLSSFHNYTQNTNHNFSPYSAYSYNNNNHYGTFPEGTAVKYDPLTSLNGANIYGYPDQIGSYYFNDFDPYVPGSVLTIIYKGLGSIATIDNTGKYTLKVSSYANFPGANIFVEHYTDNHTYLTSQTNLGSTKITLKSFDPTTYATLSGDFYQTTGKWIYRASITKDNGGESGIYADIDLNEFYYKYSGYNTTSTNFQGMPGTTINRNIFFFPTVPVL